eukprot:21252-Heterococcus_DN1.PRE.4
MKQHHFTAVQYGAAAACNDKWWSSSVTSSKWHLYGMALRQSYTGVSIFSALPLRRLICAVFSGSCHQSLS